MRRGRKRAGCVEEEKSTKRNFEKNFVYFLSL
jgi:hypothetical protein